MCTCVCVVACEYTPFSRKAQCLKHHIVNSLQQSFEFLISGFYQGLHTLSARTGWLTAILELRD